MTLVHRMRVFRQETRDCYAPERSDVTFARISDAEILRQGNVPDDVYRRQCDRLRRFGASYCYGAFIGSELAAFAWLLPHDAMMRDVPHLLTGRPGEAELTGAETLPSFRGQGLYGFVLASEFSVARENNIHTVYFKTYPKNTAALRSFAKIGAEFVGTTYYAYLPGIRAPIAWPRRFG